MDLQEIRETSVWQLFEKGRNFHRRTGIYTDSDKNYRMYNGDQWAGAKLGDVEPVQKNIIKPIVKYKVAVIHDNLYEICYSSQNYESPIFQREAVRYCDMLNGYARRLWERDELDFKNRRITKQAAINDEGIIYVDFDRENMTPVHEVVDKSDIYYGNENDDDIQAQPYILIRKRLPVVKAAELALSLGMSTDKLPYIIGDNDTFEQSGEAAKDEVDDMVTIVYKMFKQDGTVHFSVATRWVEIIEDADLGITRYPVAHFVWEEKKGSARGEGEVRYLIPNQIEINKTEMRRVLAVKHQAYPQKIADVSKIENQSALNTTGGIIKTKGITVDDVKKIVATIPPAQMSPDVKLLQDDMMNTTRELAGAGDTATGQVNPESASGKAILAVQQASQAPMTEQKESFKKFIEDIARIDMEYLIAYSEEGIDMEETVTDPMTGEEYVQVVNIPQSVFRQLKAVVKVDVTPKSVYDRFAREQTMENFLVQGLFQPQRLSEFEAYVKALPDDSVAPKQRLLDVIENIKKNQQKIAQIKAQAQLMKQRADQFLLSGPEMQAGRVSQIMAQRQNPEAAMAPMVGM